VLCNIHLRVILVLFRGGVLCIPHLSVILVYLEEEWSALRSTLSVILVSLEEGESG
jgi:hypothetical protein